MELDLFRIDWDVLIEVLITIIVLSFFIERVLSLVFEHRLYIKAFDEKGFKEPIAFITSFFVVYTWGLDAISIILSREEPHAIGYIITAGVIAGGSKASIKLFHDLLKVKSSAKNKSDGNKNNKDDAANKRQSDDNNGEQ
jgi:uncharacterized membrane protein